jgi:hypothetical protein
MASAAFIFGLLRDHDLPLLVGDLDLAFLLDLRLVHRAGAGDLGLLDLLLAADARAFLLGFGQFARPRDLGHLSRLQKLDLLLAGDTRLFLLAVDLHLQPLGLHRRAAHRHFGLGVDLRAFFF